MSKRFLLTLILSGVTALVLSGCGGTFSNKDVDPEVSRCITTLVWMSQEHYHPERGSTPVLLRGRDFTPEEIIQANCAQFLDEELITAFESGLIDASLSPTATAIAPATPGGPDDPDFTGGLGKQKDDQ